MIKKTVLITGATGGIGRQISIKFAQEGWNVICHYFSSQAKAKELNKIIGKFSVDCQLLRADLISPGELLVFVDRLKKFNIDCVINNAATQVVSKHFSQLKVRDLVDTFMANTIAPILLTSGIFMRMKERRFGRIVNISSIAAKYGGSSHSLHYGCSKLGLEGLTKTLSREGAGYNIFVNTIRPGVIDTDFHERFPKDMKKRIGLIPLKRMGYPQDIAEMAYYLGSEKNEFITNDIITIAGGE